VISSLSSGEKMPEEVFISENRKYISIRSFGELSIDELKKAIREVMLVHQEYGIAKVLVDSSQRDILPTFTDALQGAKYLGEMTNGKIKFQLLLEVIHLIIVCLCRLQCYIKRKYLISIITNPQ
jgi:hypothetical protein